MSIRAVMFDVDGVLLRHPHPSGWTVNLERDLGLAPATLQREFFAKHWQDVVNGRAGLRDRLRPVLRSVAPSISDDDLVSYWFANDAHVDRRLLAKISRLRLEGVELHLATVQEHERAAHLWGTLGLDATFDAMHYAADLGCSKPAAAFFRAVERRTGFAAQEMVLIDDQDRNAAGARANGWRAELWTGEERLREVLARAGLAPVPR